MAGKRHVASRPAAGVGLEAENDGRDLLCLGGGEPAVRFIEKAAGAFVRREQGTKGEAREEEQERGESECERGARASSP